MNAKPSFSDYLRQSASLLQAASEAGLEAPCQAAVEAIIHAFRANKPLLVCGNGGSAADAMHIAGELVGRYLKERPALRCICLSDNAAVLTAWSNDYTYDTVFARQVEAYGEEGGVFWGLSTSGNSKNVIEAAKAARAKKMTVIALTGQGGGKLAEHADILIAAPSRQTPLIQQVHICAYHHICERVEAAFAA